MNQLQVEKPGMANEVSPSALESGLPRYPGALAQLCRALGDARSVHPGAEYGLRARNIGLASYERAIALELECAHGPITVVADAHDYPALHTIALDTEPKRATALANLWLSDLLARMRTERGGTPSVKAILLTENAVDIPGVPLSFTVDGIEKHCLICDLPAALADEYARKWIARHTAPRPGAIDDIVVPGAVRLRSRRCSPLLLASLKRHDVLLGWQPSGPYVEGQPLEHASLRFGAARGRRLIAGVRVDTHSVTLETHVTTVNDAQLDDFNPHAAASAAGANEAIVEVAAMDLPVHIELLTVNLSVAQLGALQPGYVVDLPLPVSDAAVRLVSYGQTIALGKLVAVGDNLGLQIERMAASDERQS
ncbi:YscQ/HrcQ family type III secretion apparatus protein [Trinickia terrae]|uniref:YscQ/HrcQ family type III secretion apparatus protein n=1 Tax=Trinickia terrae TaxID=2571161 RepID=A0A4V5PJI6_9BURK|nr:type III secretion system cytoplasmic ring protein SctQ [Trinickia terrae]TKC91520.1 YscQ/HrcQ family type III secretion apparatus protein [Trinickia terrae]